MSVREIHVGDEQRAVHRDLEDDVRERLVRRDHGVAPAGGALGAEHIPQRLAERPPGRARGVRPSEARPRAAGRIPRGSPPVPTGDRALEARSPRWPGRSRPARSVPGASPAPVRRPLHRPNEGIAGLREGRFRPGEPHYARGGLMQSRRAHPAIRLVAGNRPDRRSGSDSQCRQRRLHRLPRARPSSPTSIAPLWARRSTAFRRESFGVFRTSVPWRSGPPISPAPSPGASRISGISSVGTPERRFSASEPGLTAMYSAGVPYQWQYTATRVGEVPDSVLRARPQTSRSP